MPDVSIIIRCMWRVQFSTFDKHCRRRSVSAGGTLRRRSIIILPVAAVWEKIIQKKKNGHESELKKPKSGGTGRFDVVEDVDVDTRRRLMLIAQQSLDL